MMCYSLHILSLLCMLVCLLCLVRISCFFFFFLNDTATTEIYPLPLPDALPISAPPRRPAGGCRPREKGRQAEGLERPGDPGPGQPHPRGRQRPPRRGLARPQARPHHGRAEDRKSTRLNSSHDQISYAVFCLKKK